MQMAKGQMAKGQRLVPIFKFWDWRNLFSLYYYSPPSYEPPRFIVKKSWRESQRGHRKAWTPYHESKKKTTRFDGPTQTHIHSLATHTHTLIAS